MLNNKMEHNFPLNTISISLFLCFVFSICILWNKSKPSRKGKLPPGPWKLPFIGSLHHLLLSSSSLPHHTLANLSKKYGPLMHLQLGEISTVIVSYPEMAKAITKTHDLIFANRPKITAFDIAFYNCTDIGFSPYGEYWRQMRKICVMELLSARMVTSFSSIRHEELSKIVSSILESSPSPVNLTEKADWFSSSVVYKAAFGRRPCRVEDQERFVRLMKNVLSFAGGFDLGDLFPSMRWMIHYVSGTKSRLLEMHHELDQICESIIEEHMHHKEKNNMYNHNNNTEVKVEEDILDVLLRVMEDGKHDFPITRDNIKAIIHDIFTAGTDTSGIISIWTISEMIKRPSIMAKAQAEVRQVLKGKKIFDDKDLEELTYLNYIIKETFRLHPPSPFTLPRESMKEVRIGEYTIPNKTRLLINIWAIGRDPNSWEDPERFIPERFENNCVDFMGQHYEFIPFGAGRRMCPGISFALAGITHLLAGLLYHFDWEIPNGVSPEDFDMSEAFSMLALRKNDLCLIASPAQFQEENVICTSSV